MKRAVLVLASLVLALGLAGCADDFDHDLNGLIGQPVQVAIARLGQPEISRPNVNGPTYSWVGARQRVNDSDGPNSGSRCRIEAKTDRQGVVFATRYSGNRKTCSGFAAALHAGARRRR